MPLICIGGALALSYGVRLWLESHKRNRNPCGNHLKQIGLAFKSYHNLHGCLPPAYIADDNGRPLHSWRVLLLPHLDQMRLYTRYRWDEPWNGPNNRKLHKHIVEVFRCPHDDGGLKSTSTSYVAVVGAETAWLGAQPLTFDDFEDGLQNTLLLVETANSGIHWMEPRDLDFSEMAPTINAETGRGISSKHGLNIAQVLLANGSVRVLNERMSPVTLRTLLTRNGGETVGDF